MPYRSAGSAVRSAESALQVAERNQERSERLEQAGAVQWGTRDRPANATQRGWGVGGRLSLARGGVEAAGGHRRRAPFDGVVSDRHVDAGDVAQVGA